MLPFVLPSFEENEPLQLVKPMAILLNAAKAADDHIQIRFGRNEYISPAIAPFLLAARDIMDAKKLRINFASDNVKGNREFARFFFDSGLYHSTSGALRSSLDALDKEHHLRPGKVFQASAHALDLADARAKGDMKSMAREAMLTVAAMPQDIPVAFSHMLIAQIFELLNNSYVHSNSDNVYTMCVNTKHNNTLAIVYDTGIGIPSAYESFRERIGLPQLEDEKAIVWAMASGHSTKQYTDPNPRGIGYQVLHDFAKEHHGAMTVASGRGIYQYNEDDAGSVMLTRMTFSLPGTFFMLRIPYAQ